MTRREFDKLPRDMVQHIATAKAYSTTFSVILPGKVVEDDRIVTITSYTKILAYNRYGKERKAYHYRGRDYRNVDDLLTAINNDESK